jgi:2-polyprenyl-3-methyl-5-hydroxy-6-metoxy-1,4-benzoquinol methylase
MIKRVLRKIKRILTPKAPRFDLTGERVDILYGNKINFDILDMFQKSHYKRYEYALEVVETNDICGDFACGTGYGSIMIAQKAKKVIGADINKKVINAIQKRYRHIKNVQFVCKDLLNFFSDGVFDCIISFETIEHFTEGNILSLLTIFYNNLKPNGKLIISTPYLQQDDEAALKLGHHLTFHIDEKKIESWSSTTGFEIVNLKYQNYETHIIETHTEKKDFIICVLRKR